MIAVDDIIVETKTRIKELIGREIKPYLEGFHNGLSKAQQYQILTTALSSLTTVASKRALDFFEYDMEVASGSRYTKKPKADSQDML